MQTSFCLVVFAMFLVPLCHVDAEETEEQPPTKETSTTPPAEESSPSEPEATTEAANITEPSKPGRSNRIGYLAH
jgi:hypothetical protein